MQVNEDLIRNVVAQVLAEVGQAPQVAWLQPGRSARHLPLTPRRPWPPPARPSSSCPSARLEDRKRIIDHIRRISIDQCVELGTMEMEETKIGRLRAQDREAEDAGRADAGRRVPAQRGLQRRPRPGRDRTCSVRRDRRDHARDPLAADDHRQRGQHDRRRQHAGRQPAPQRQDGWRPRACGASTRRSHRDLGIDNLICVIAEPTLETADAIFQAPRRGPDLRDRRTRRGPRRAEQRQAGHRGRAGQSAGRRRRNGRSGPRRALHHPGRVLRQQPALHRRKGSLRRRSRSSTQHDGRPWSEPARCG